MRGFSLILAFYLVFSGALWASLPDPNAPPPSSSKAGVDVKELNDSKDLGPESNRTGTVDPHAEAPYTSIPSHGAATTDPAPADGAEKDEALFKLEKPIRLINFNEKNFFGRVGIIFLQPFEDIITALINQIGTDMTMGGFKNVGWLSPIEAKRARDKALSDIQKNAEAVVTPADCPTCKNPGQMTPINPNGMTGVFYRNGTKPPTATPPKT